MEILNINHKLYWENEKRKKVCICVCMLGIFVGIRKLNPHKKYILSKTGRFMK